MSLKTITIDFWNTLFDSENGIERNAYRQKALKTEIERLGQDFEKLDFHTALTASWEFFNNIWKNEVRTPSTIETVNFFWNYLNLPYDDEAVENVARAFAECILHYPPNIIDGVRESLEALSQQYKLGIISDTGFSPGSILKQLLDQQGVLGYFSAFSFSDETGVSKPHPKAYWTILDQLGCEPEDALHIGDIELTDITGAKRLGMKAIRFSGDKTGNVSKDNTERTLADIDLASWKEIVSYIGSIDNHRSVTYSR